MTIRVCGFSYKYYYFRQNNSGGYFRPPAINVIVEAVTFEQANKVALDNGLYFGGVASRIDCNCGCGDRWSPVDDFDSFDMIDIDSLGYRYSIHGDIIWWKVYHADGTTTQEEQ